MAIEDPELRQLLHSLDDSKSLEFPDSFDWHRARSRFRELAERLNRDFDGQWFSGDEMEDASQHGSLIIPAAGTASHHRLVVTISNFGDLAVLSVDKPFEWTDEETAELLHPDDARRITSALADLGYKLIPEDPLWETYDGCRPGQFPTWWSRYFGYV